MSLIYNTARQSQKQRATLLATALLLLLCFMQLADAAQAELKPWPAENRLDEFKLPDFKGNNHSLADYKGKVVLVNFWASWCPPCITEMPELTKLKNQLAGEPFEILAINVGEKKYRVRKFAKLVNFKLPVLLDTSSETFKSWGVKTLPTSFLIDAKGQVRYRVRGNPGWDQDKTLTIIENLIAEPTITTTTEN